MFTCLLSGFWSLSGVAERAACRSRQVHSRLLRPRHTFWILTTEWKLSQSATSQRVSVPRQAAWIDVAVRSQNSIASRVSYPLHAAWMATAALASAEASCKTEAVGTVRRGVDANPWPAVRFAGRRTSSSMEPSRPRSILATASAEVTGWPSISRMMSPGSSPEPAAAPSGSTRVRVARSSAAWKERPRRLRPCPGQP